MINGLVRILDVTERAASRVLTPLVHASVQVAARATKRGKYRRWRQRQSKAAGGARRRSGAGWE